MTTPAQEGAPNLAVGQKLGKYLLAEKLGEGAMGVVFAGVHEALGREVAIKVLRGEFSKNEKVVIRFQQEAEAVSRIGHANIVAVYDFGRLDDGSLYYVMERIRGVTLTKRMRDAPVMGPEETVSIVGQVCRALQATHQRNIVHRDLKPDNIMLLPQKNGMPHVKIVDFGVAKMRDPNEEGSKLTSSGTLLGTPTYMAPEQITSPLSVDGRADIYSLGAILFEILTGAKLFTGDVMTVLSKHVREMPPPPSTRSERPIPPALDKVVLKALSKNPNDRQKDPATLMQEVEAAWNIRVTGTMRATSGSMRPVTGAMRPVTASMAEAVANDPSMATMAGPEGATMANTSQPGMSQPGISQAGVTVAGISQAGMTQISATGANALVAPRGGNGKWIIVGAVAIAGGILGGALMMTRHKAPVPVVAAGTPEAPAATGAAPVAVAPPTVQRPLQMEANRVLAGALTADATQRRAAVEAMGEVGDHGSVEQIITALGDDNPEVRRAAAIAAITVGRPEDAALKAALSEAAGRSGGAVATDLAAARFHLGDETAEVDLKRALEQRDPVARLRAALAFAKAGKLPAATLRDAITAAPPTVKRSLRWASFVQLHGMKDPQFEADLAKALETGEPQAKLDAAEALARDATDEKAKGVLRDTVASTADLVDRMDAAAVLAHIKDPGAEAVLVAGLSAPLPAARAHAAIALGRNAAVLSDQNKIEKQLWPLLKDGDAAPRIAAAAAMLALNPAAPAKP